MDSFKYSFQSTIRENLGLAVYNTGYQKCYSRHTWGPATRDHYLIHYISAGKGIYTYNGKSHPLGQGDMFLIFPSQIAYYVADNEDPWEYYWVGFNGTEAKRMINLSGFSRESPVLRLPEIVQAKTLLLNIYNSRGNSPAADANMIGYLFLFFSRLIQERDNTRSSYGTRDYLAQALRFIQYNYAGEIGVTEIAAYAGISRSQLYRAFLAYFNISPNEFLQKYRINEACSLLHGRDFTVAEVANSVGFADPLYFSRVFKKIKGITPTEYQNGAIAPADAKPDNSDGFSKKIKGNTYEGEIQS